MSGRARLNRAVVDQVAKAGGGGRFLVGTVQGIEVNPGRARVYLVEGRPMPLLSTGESAEIVRGSQVLFWDGQPPFALGLIVSD